MPDSLRTVHLYRALVWVLVAIAAVVVWGVSGPISDSETDFASAIRLADVSYEANNSRTDGAPQQQVVNGWYVRDVLPVLAAQNSVIIERTGLLSTMLLVFGLGLSADVIGSSLLKNRKPAAPAVAQGSMVPNPSSPADVGPAQEGAFGSPVSGPSATPIGAPPAQPSGPSIPPNVAKPTQPTWTPPQS